MLTRAVKPNNHEGSWEVRLPKSEGGKWGAYLLGEGHYVLHCHMSHLMTAFLGCWSSYPHFLSNYPSSLTFSWMTLTQP